MAEPTPAPFGTHAPRGMASTARLLSTRIRHRGPLKKVVISALYRLAGGREQGRAFDVELFDGVKARLYPADNISEKRCFAAPQFWDRAERAALGDAVRNARYDATEDNPFVFVDVGANAGLYSLSVLAEARRWGVPLRILAIEPDPMMRERMIVNFQLNDIANAEILPYAVTREAGTVTLHQHQTNRGQASLDGTGPGLEAVGRPLKDILDEAGVGMTHAMKVDIEGTDVPALEGLFNAAPRTRWPIILCVEVIGPGSECPSRFCQRHGYVPLVETPRNAVLGRDG